MACRLVNLHEHPLRVDLRGGASLLLAPGDQTRALREEWLYDNEHLGEWERAGWVRRIPARMSEVLSADSAAAAQKAAPAVAKKTAVRAAKAAKTSVRRKAARR